MCTNVYSASDAIFFFKKKTKRFFINIVVQIFTFGPKARGGLWKLIRTIKRPDSDMAQSRFSTALTLHKEVPLFSTVLFIRWKRSTHAIVALKLVGFFLVIKNCEICGVQYAYVCFLNIHIHKFPNSFLSRCWGTSNFF